MRNTILTPITLWQNFNDGLPLKEVTIKSMLIGNAELNYIYFSGRKTESGRVRIYGLYAKQKGKSKGSILIIPDYKDTIDPEIVVHFSNLGFDVLCVDYYGYNEKLLDFTKYPEDVSYANYINSEKTFNFVEKTAKETCWYEWTAVARYAVSFLKAKTPESKIGVLGIKHGANVLWQLASMDKRVDASVFLYGAGWLAYKNTYKLIGNNIEIDDERTKFLAGIDSQAYAQFVECPVLYLTSTNSEEFDSDRAIDTILRLNNKDAYINFITNSKSILDIHALEDCEIFFKKYLSGEKISLGQPKIDIEIDGEDAIFNVTSTKKANITSVHVFSSFNDVNPKDRIWYNVLNYTQNKSGSYKFKQRVFGDCETIIAFAVVKYNNGFTVSSNYCYKKVNLKTTANVPSLLFSSTKMPSNFIVENINSKLLGNVFTLDRLYKLETGPCDICGISSENTLTTYAVRKFAHNLNSDSFIKFDVYFKTNDTLIVSVKNSQNNEYFYKLSVSGEESWQNIQLTLADFKNQSGQPIKNLNDIVSLSISALGTFMVNNFILI